MPLSNFVTTVLLICHGILAVILLGALTHQVIAAIAIQEVSGRAGLFPSLRRVRPELYTTSIVILYVATALLGGIIYTSYRVHVRPFLEAMHLWSAHGLFELKEHFVAIGLGVLPAYWHCWNDQDNSVNLLSRIAITVFLAFTVWWGFLIGHVLNNIRGFGV